MQSQNEKKSSPAKSANRILYMVVAGVLCIGAAVIGIAYSAGVFSPAVTTPSPSPSPDVDAGTPPIVEEVDTLPVFVAPSSGFITKEHSTDVLVFNPTMGHWRIHKGIDVTGEVGAPVYAAADGVVESVYLDPLYGKCVRIAHSGKAVTVYCNLQDELAEGITAGATVKSGQLLGAVGDTALSEVAEEPHLHFEMEIDDVSVNPLDYISKESQEACFTFDDTVYEG